MFAWIVQPVSTTCITYTMTIFCARLPHKLIYTERFDSTLHDKYKRKTTQAGNSSVVIKYVTGLDQTMLGLGASIIHIP